MNSRMPPPPAMPGTVVAKPPRRLVKPCEIMPVAPKLVLNAVEGFGKTTFAAYSPDPIILMARGETGYRTLLNAGRVPQVPAELVDSWPDALGWVSDLIADPQGRKTLVLDATGGFERLCHEFVCNRDFGGDWGERGFASFARGYEVSVPEWLKFLQLLERLNVERGVGIVMLGHSKIKSFKNPMGSDFDRFIGDSHEKTWGVTAKWADAVLFGNFFTVIKEGRGKAKGVGGTDRVIYTERRDAFDAKNRYGMPPEIWLTNIGPESMWETVRKLMEPTPKQEATE